MISNSEFNRRVKAVSKARDERINLVESRLKDLTGLRLSKDPKYQFLCNDNYDKKPIKRSGKDIIVVFPTDFIEKDLKTDNQFDVWNFILGEIRPDPVFQISPEYKKCELGDDAKIQLQNIRDEILQYDYCNDNLSCDYHNDEYHNEDDYSEDEFSIIELLGVFSYNEHMIKLFAQVIACHSIYLGVESADLAFVVLTHELAHAYSIAGYDINGFRGILLESPNTRNKYVIEGLAQYYTEAICHQLEKKYSQFKVAFDALLAGQTIPYTWHSHWFGESKSHEDLRNLMLDYRHTGSSTDFISRLRLSQSVFISLP